MMEIDLFNNSINNTTSTYNDSEYYYYDYDISVSNIPLGEILPLTLAYGITLLIGIVGNFLVIFAVCRYKRLRSITNSFLTSLAIADLLLLLICIPIKCAAFASFSWTFGEFLCKFVNYMQNVSMICSVMTLTVMSNERWVAILYPLKAKYLCTYSHARQMIAVIWTASFIMAIPVLIGQKHILVGERIKAYWCITDWSSTEMEILFQVYRLTLLFIIPMTVMIIAYTGICKELLQLSTVRGNLTSSSCGKRPVTRSSSDGTTSPPLCEKSDIEKSSKKKKTDDVDEKTMKVIQMLIVVVVLFAICWGPILINNLLVAVGAIEKYHYDYLKPMRQAFFLMSYFNSCSNPIVYGFMSKHFRRSFQRAIMSCFCCRNKKPFHKIRYSLNATKSTVLYSGHLNRNRQQQDKKNNKKGVGQFYRTDTASPLVGIKLATLHASPTKRITANINQV